MANLLWAITWKKNFFKKNSPGNHQGDKETNNFLILEMSFIKIATDIYRGKKNSFWCETTVIAKNYQCHTQLTAM